jgi:hypothetical protein
MDDEARLEPHIGVALQAAALARDREAPLKRDIMIYVGQSINNQSGIHQWHSPLRPNMLSLMRKAGIEKFVESSRQFDIPRPATVQPLARPRVPVVFQEPCRPNLAFFPLYTTNAEGMIASTTGAALAFGRAMLLCLGLTSPLI